MVARDLSHVVRTERFRQHAKTDGRRSLAIRSPCTVAGPRNAYSASVLIARGLLADTIERPSCEAEHAGPVHAMTTRRLSLGATELARAVTRHGPRELGRRTGASESAIRSWATGEREPSGPSRSALQKIGIDPKAWSTPATASKRAPTPATPPTSPTPPRSTPPATARDRAIEQVDQLRADIAQARATAASYRDLAALESTHVSALRNLARLSGELEVSESAILRSAAWSRAMRLVREVLERHPVAAGELAEAIERFARDGA